MTPKELKMEAVEIGLLDLLREVAGDEGEGEVEEVVD